MKVKQKSEKVGLKLNIQKTNIMANNGETMEKWQIIFSYARKSL